MAVVATVGVMGRRGFLLQTTTFLVATTITGGRIRMYDIYLRLIHVMTPDTTRIPPASIEHDPSHPISIKPIRFSSCCRGSVAPP